jgi:tRNA nucleotidyltransferase (CCA-adding enzyme)
VLHPLSFIEDPTRVIRGARLAGRLSFDFALDTAEKARAVLRSDAVANVSRARLRAELELTLSERRVSPALRRLDELGALAAMFGLSLSGEPHPAGELVEGLDTLRRTATVPMEAYVLALLLGVDARAAQQHVESFNWALRLIETRDRIARMAADPGAFTDDDLEGLEESASLVLRVADPRWDDRHARLLAEPPRRRLRGKDVVALGLPQGPAVGRVLAEVTRARAAQRTTDFEDELELARRLIDEMRSASGVLE